MDSAQLVNPTPELQTTLSEVPHHHHLSQTALAPHIEGNTPSGEEEHHHVWGENEEEEVGLHITASVDPRELTNEEIPSTTPLMEDRHLPLPSVLEL